MKQRLKAEFQILLYGIKSLAPRVGLREISLSKQSKVTKEKKENNCEIMKIIHRRKSKQKRKTDRHFLKRLD